MGLNQINDLLKRYTIGICTPLEKQLVEKWLEQNWKENDDWKYMDDSSREKWLESLFANVKHSILSNEEKSTAVLSITRSNTVKIISSIAATVIIVLGLYFVTSPLLNSKNEAIYEQVQAVSRERREIILADGTKVWLNSGSTLKYPKKFAHDEREVYLQGEAYFEVAHNAKVPFIVHTDKLKTKVLGTVFNIRAYQNDPAVKVTLISGKVEVTNTEEDNNKEAKGLVLLPNQVASYQKESKSLIKSNINNTDPYSGWKDGKLIFEETPMREVLERLNISYGITCKLRDPKGNNCTITGSFNTSQNIEEILKSISISTGGKYEKDGAGFTLYGEGCSDSKML